MPILPGERAPSFRAATPSNPNYPFDFVGGRYVLLAFLHGASAADRKQVLDTLAAERSRFDDERLCFFGVLSDPATMATAEDSHPGIRWFLDGDHAVRARFEAMRIEDLALGWLLLDPQLRTLAALPLDQASRMLRVIDLLPPPALHAGVPTPAPVMIVPRVFEPAFCRTLIDAYRSHGGRPSGFMRETQGVTSVVVDRDSKRRSDHLIDDKGLRDQIVARLRRRLLPEIEKATHFTATRIERYLLACYDSEEQGFFRPHRDNTTKGTAHRKFAVTINLNAEDYEGGDLRFPEFGPQTYRAPTGGAVVFSCSLLHEALPVTAGRRYAYLPFLYDDAGARLREQNDVHLSPELQGYRVQEGS